MNIWGHFKTITTHKLMVMGYCFRVGLYRQGLLHDLSKYSPTEFLMGIQYYQGNRSPNNAEREQTGLSKAWLHHKGRNKHHFEYWVDYGIGAEHVLAGMPMPRKYIAEMVMDRISASRVYHPETYSDDAPLKYYEKGKNRLWFIHEDTKKQLEYLLKMLAVKGEAATLSYIKYVYLKGKGRFGGEGDTYLSKPFDGAGTRKDANSGSKKSNESSDPQKSNESSGPQKSNESSGPQKCNVDSGSQKSNESSGLQKCNANSGSQKRIDK